MKPPNDTMDVKEKNAAKKKIKKRKKIESDATNSVEVTMSLSLISSERNARSESVELKVQKRKTSNIQEDNAQINSSFEMNVKSKRGRKSNKEKLSLYKSKSKSESNQSDLHTFVGVKNAQTKNVLGEHEVKTNVNKGKRKTICTTIVVEDDRENKNGEDLNEFERVEVMEQKNAFAVMMDSRHKSIGRNSPGRVLQENEIDIHHIVDNKSKLSARKSLLEKWSNSKGGLKRKVEDEEKQIYINRKLERRAKRMKKMLSISSSDKRKPSPKRKKSRKLESDSDFDADSSDTEKQDKGIKFKIKFSPKVFKRRRRLDSSSNNLSSNKKDDDESVKTERNKPKASNHHSDMSKSKTTTNKRSKLKDTDNVTDESSSGDSDKKDVLEISDDSSSGTAISAGKSTTETVLDADVVETNVRRSLRKPAIKYFDSNLVSLTSETEYSDDDIIVKKRRKTTKLKEMKDVKIAPVFLRSTPKPKLDPAVIEARKQFLMSGVPNSLKKVIEKQQSVEDIVYDIFPSISHVQQRKSDKEIIDYWNLPTVNLRYYVDETYTPELKEISLLSLLDCTRTEPKQKSSCSSSKIKNFKSSLHEIKAMNPDYPVFKCVRLLQEKLGMKSKKKRSRKHKTACISNKTDESTMWTEKFKATTSNDIIGNHMCTSKLKRWLQSWIEYSREMKFQKSSSSGSDFDCSDSESTKTPCNTIILAGPNGSGKTMTIYALCNELNVNVLELNASNKRTGKRLLQDLQEATQSHQIRKNELNGLISFVQKQAESAEEITKKQKMCLLLVDDVDVIFDQDEGFLRALGQLLSTSKRPIALVTSDPNCVYLRKFIQQYPIVKFAPLSAPVLSTWLQILCLIVGMTVDKEVIGELLERNRGDARRTVLQLQFLVQSGGHITENSFDSEITKEVQTLDCHWENTSLTLACAWSNLPSFFNISPISHDFVSHTVDTSNDVGDLQKLVDVFDTFATSDAVCSKHKFDCDSEPCPKFWQQCTQDGLELTENMETYDGRKEFIDDWMQYLLTEQLGISVTSQLGKTFPTSSEHRWRSKQHTCENKFSEVIPLSCQLDRKGFALDYFPALRTVARSEKQRASTNSKRGNRFYNYFRTLGFTCTDTINQTACDILRIDHNNDCKK